MHAESGDWLIVHSRNDGGHVRKAEILETGAGGRPPYSVRWIDDDRKSVVFPGPDAQIVPVAEQATMDRAQNELIARVQSSIGAHNGTE